MAADDILMVASWLEAIDLCTAEGRIAEALGKPRARNDGVTRGDLADESVIMRTSTHEAAHAVVSHRSGRRVTRASVRQDGTGSVEYERTEGTIADVITSIVSGLAGIFSELLSGESDLGRRYALKTSYDVVVAGTQIRQLQAQVPGWNLSEDTFAKLSCCAVRSNWKTIVRVAAVLRACGEIDGATVDALCGPIQ